MLSTRRIVELVDEWNAIAGRGPEHWRARADVVQQIVNTGHEWVTGYNVARFVGYLAGTATVHDFVRLLQAESERVTA